MTTREQITIEGARILFRNFSGKEGEYNREGDRNFVLLLDDGVAQELANEGWNIKHLKPREEGDEPQPYVQVTVSYKGRPPRVVLITSRGRTNLDEDTIEVLDWCDIQHVDLMLNPYHWTVKDKSGIKAYLHAIYVTIVEDELELKYADVPDSAQNSFEYQED